MRLRNEGTHDCFLRPNAAARESPQRSTAVRPAELSALSLVPLAVVPELSPAERSAVPSV